MRTFCTSTDVKELKREGAVRILPELYPEASAVSCVLQQGARCDLAAINGSFVQSQPGLGLLTADLPLFTANL